MSKTKFTKVAVEDRLPSEQGMYMVIFKDNKVGTFNFWNEEGFIDSWKEDVDFWLEESPDREDDMIAILKEIHFDHFWNGNHLSIDIKTKIESLLQSLKQ